MERKKLFARKKLFSNVYNEGGMTLRTLICHDCGERIETAENCSSVICPNCGGKRFNISLFPEKKEVERKQLFGDTPFETKLKEFSGKEITREEFEKTFSDKSEDLLEKGFATCDGDQVKIINNAYGFEKLFSKLIISVTKTLVLDPSIVEGRESKEEIIEDLRDRLPEKAFLHLHKAHGLNPVIEPEHREYSEPQEDWVADSGIVQDLETEYNNQSFGVEQFVKILRGRYPDAPENIIDILVEMGVIFTENGKITIHKTN